MNNYYSMTTQFDRRKNQQALMYTIAIAGALLLLFIFLKWPLPEIPVPIADDYIEINLGNGDTGSGDDQPQLPGEPAPAEQATYVPPQPQAVQAAEDVKQVETDDAPDNNSVAIKNPPVAKPNATRINADAKVVRTTTPQTAVVTNAPPRPRAVMGRTMGGNGNGGNGADTYRPGTNEGISGGTGDQGRPGGDPNGGVYTGAPRNFGVKVLNVPAQSFEDDFNENAKIAMDIVTDANGKVISATFQPRGSSTSKKNLIDIARRRAFELRNIGVEGPAKGTVIFNFKVRG